MTRWRRQSTLAEPLLPYPPYPLYCYTVVRASVSRRGPSAVVCDGGEGGVSYTYKGKVTITPFL